MATYAELFDLKSNTVFRNKVAVAVVVKAQGLLDGGTPTHAQIDWAVEAIRAPMGKASELVNYVLAANKNLDTATILAASDSAIQTNVDAAVDAIVAGGS